jgi:hypothetical protein
MSPTIPLPVLAIAYQEAHAPPPHSSAPPLPAFARRYFRDVADGRSPFAPPASPLLPAIDTGHRLRRRAIDRGAATYRPALAVAAGWPCAGCGRQVGGDDTLCAACEALGG